MIKRAVGATRVVLSGLLLLGVVGVLTVLPARAQNTTSNGFSLQVTPSPIIATLKPGEKKTIDLKIRNVNTQPEKLKIALRSFKIDDASGDIQINETEPGDVTSWVTFAQPTFNIDAGAWFTETITMNPPSDAGFSYSFVISISRQNSTTPEVGSTSIEGSVAIFTLVGIDRPDAVRKLDLVELKLDKKAYEYLPADIKIKLKNSGNTLIQPKGNIFIQRDSKDTEPLAVLPLNDKDSYLPAGSTRTLSTSWNDGFPVFETHTINNVTTTDKKLTWNWNKLNRLRIGHYVAKMVAVYDNGQRDVSIEAEVGFWVIPWKLIIGALAVIGLVAVGIVTIIKNSYIAARRKKHEKSSDN